MTKVSTKCAYRTRERSVILLLWIYSVYPSAGITPGSNHNKKSLWSSWRAGSTAVEQPDDGVLDDYIEFLLASADNKVSEAENPLWKHNPQLWTKDTDDVILATTQMEVDMQESNSDPISKDMTVEEIVEDSSEVLLEEVGDLIQAEEENDESSLEPDFFLGPSAVNSAASSVDEEDEEDINRESSTITKNSNKKLSLWSKIVQVVTKQHETIEDVVESMEVVDEAIIDERPVLRMDVNKDDEVEKETTASSIVQVSVEKNRPVLTLEVEKEEDEEVVIEASLEAEEEIVDTFIDDSKVETGEEQEKAVLSEEEEESKLINKTYRGSLWAMRNTYDRAWGTVRGIFGKKNALTQEVPKAEETTIEEEEDTPFEEMIEEAAAEETHTTIPRDYTKIYTKYFATTETMTEEDEGMAQEGILPLEFEDSESEEIELEILVDPIEEGEETDKEDIDLIESTELVEDEEETYLEKEEESDFLEEAFEIVEDEFSAEEGILEAQGEDVNLIEAVETAGDTPKNEESDMIEGVDTVEDALTEDEEMLEEEVELNIDEEVEESIETSDQWLDEKEILKDEEVEVGVVETMKTLEDTEDGRGEEVDLVEALETVEDIPEEDKKVLEEDDGYDIEVVEDFKRVEDLLEVDEEQLIDFKESLENIEDALQVVDEELMEESGDDLIDLVESNESIEDVEREPLYSSEVHEASTVFELVPDEDQFFEASESSMHDDEEVESDINNLEMDVEMIDVFTDLIDEEDDFKKEDIEGIVPETLESLQDTENMGPMEVKDEVFEETEIAVDANSNTFKYEIQDNDVDFDGTIESLSEVDEKLSATFYVESDVEETCEPSPLSASDSSQLSKVKPTNFIFRFLVNKGFGLLAMVIILFAEWCKLYLFPPVVELLHWVAQKETPSLFESERELLRLFGLRGGSDVASDFEAGEEGEDSLGEGNSLQEDDKESQKDEDDTEKDESKEKYSELPERLQTDPMPTPRARPNLIYRELLGYGWPGHTLIMVFVYGVQWVNVYLPILANVLQKVKSQVWQNKGVFSDDLDSQASQSAGFVRADGSVVRGGRKQKARTRKDDQKALNQLQQIEDIGQARYRFVSESFMRRHGIGPYAGERPAIEIHTFSGEKGYESEESDNDWVVEALTKDEAQGKKDSSFDTSVGLSYGSGGPAVSVGVNFDLGGKTRKTKKRPTVTDVARQTSVSTKRKPVGPRVSDRESGVMGRIRAAGANSLVGRSILGAYPGDLPAPEEAADADGLSDLAQKYGYGDWSDDEETFDFSSRRRKRTSSTKRRKRKPSQQAEILFEFGSSPERPRTSPARRKRKSSSESSKQRIPKKKTSSYSPTDLLNDPRENKVTGATIDFLKEELQNRKDTKSNND